MVENSSHVKRAIKERLNFVLSVLASDELVIKLSHGFQKRGVIEADYHSVSIRLDACAKLHKCGVEPTASTITGLILWREPAVFGIWFDLSPFRVRHGARSECCIFSRTPTE
jgi:hypothetical protein